MPGQSIMTVRRLALLFPLVCTLVACAIVRWEIVRGHRLNRELASTEQTFKTLLAQHPEVTAAHGADDHDEDGDEHAHGTH